MASSKLPEIAYGFATSVPASFREILRKFSLNAHAEELHTYKFVRTHSQGDHNQGDACDIGSTVKGIAKEMPVLLKYAKQRIVALKGSGLKHGDVVYALRRENITTSRQTVRWFYFRYLEGWYDQLAPRIREAINIGRAVLSDG